MSQDILVCVALFSVVGGELEARSLFACCRSHKRPLLVLLFWCGYTVACLARISTGKLWKVCSLCGLTSVLSKTPTNSHHLMVVRVIRNTACMNLLEPTNQPVQIKKSHARTPTPPATTLSDFGACPACIDPQAVPQELCRHHSDDERDDDDHKG